VQRDTVRLTRDPAAPVGYHQGCRISVTPAMTPISKTPTLRRP